MTDHELLKLAAKAAGHEIKSCPGWPTGAELVRRVVPEPPEPYSKWLIWRPLTDDGDALRLATRLLIDIGHNHPAEQQRYVVADRRGCEGVFSPISYIEDEFEERDRAAATRRAIVRAAAAIGEAMQ